MNTQIIPQQRNELSPTQLMHQAGQAANKAAARNVFESYRAAKSQRTLSGYQTAVSLFADFLSEVHPALAAGDFYNDVAAWAGITWGMVEAFKNWMLTQGYALGSINQRLAIIKLHLKLAYKADVLTDETFGAIQGKTSGVPSPGTKAAKRINENREVSRIGHKKEEAIFITANDAKCLKGQPQTAVGARDRLLMTLLIDHGLRVSEAAALRVSDIDQASGKMTFERQKTNVDGRHHLTADTLLALQAWLPIRAAVASPDNDSLLLASAKGDKLQNSGMSTRAITKRVAYLGIKCGYAREKQVKGEPVTIGSLSAHDMRHYCAECMVNQGYDVPALIDWFGWSPQTAVKMIDTYRQKGKFAKRDKG